MPSKYDAINKLKAKNPELTWTQAANQAGFEGEWTSYKGKAKPRTGDVRGQTRRRASFDQPSTEMAGYEAKRLQQESTRISTEAEMFGLEPTQIEHLADQEDIRSLTAGSGGDPINKSIVRQSEARFKDRVKQLVPPGYAVTLNPTADSVRVIEQRFFDPIADPTTLPGVDIPIGTKLEKVTDFTAQFKNGVARIVPRVGPLAAAGALLDVGGVQAAVQQAQQPMGARESLATALEGVSSAAGLASLTPAAPVAGPVSLATGAAAAAVRGKAEQKIPQALEKVQEVQKQVFPLQDMINRLGVNFAKGAVQLGF